MRGRREAEGRRDVGGSRGGREEGKKRQTGVGELWEERGWLVASGWLLTQPQLICVLCHFSGADSESGDHWPNLHWSCSQPCI